MADKLVSADYLKERFAYYAAAHNLPLEGYCYFQAMKEVDGAPVVDAVPVVRCKDCKHAFDSYDSLRCNRLGCYDTALAVDGSFFCSYGERREAASNG